MPGTIRSGGVLGHLAGAVVFGAVALNIYYWFASATLFETPV